MISIHAPRVGCDLHDTLIKNKFLYISIHAPRVGCDQRGGRIISCGLISIHAPRVGCDRIKCPTVNRKDVFQSTHPVWGATMPEHILSLSYDFNPRTPCGVRLG